jgi:hypothetical protein
VCGLDSFGSGYEPVAVNCERDNKHSDSVKCWETTPWSRVLLDKLVVAHLVKLFAYVES